MSIAQIQAAVRALTTPAGAASGSAAVILAAVGLSDAYQLYNNTETLAGRLDQNITFPPDLNRNQSIPFMSMEFQRYERRSINQQPFYNEVMKIRLPIPENLSEKTSLSYDNPALGSALGSMIEAASVGPNVDTNTRLGTVGSGLFVGGLSELATNAAAQGQRENATTRERAIGAAGQIGQIAGVAAGALLGITANPYQVTLFKSPQLRMHTFSWKFIPTTLEESELIRRLVEIFKYHSLPGISNAGAVFFSYPEILKINFRPNDRYLYKFKPCVVTDVTINYAPNSPSFVKSSGAPTAVQLTISLQEIEIMTKADFIRDERGLFSIGNREQTVRELNEAIDRRLGSTQPPRGVDNEF